MIFCMAYVAEEYIENLEDGKSKCTICGRSFTQKCDSKRHIHAKHIGIQQNVSVEKHSKPNNILLII